MAFVTPVVEHWLEREIAQWVHPMNEIPCCYLVKVVHEVGFLYCYLSGPLPLSEAMKPMLIGHRVAL